MSFGDKAYKITEVYSDQYLQQKVDDHERVFGERMKIGEKTKISFYRISDFYFIGQKSFSNEGVLLNQFIKNSIKTNIPIDKSLFYVERSKVKIIKVFSFEEHMKKKADLLKN